MKLSDFMTSPVLSIPLVAPLSAARALMSEYEISHLPVVQDAQVVGLLTRRHLRWSASRHHEPCGLTEPKVGDVMTRQLVMRAPNASAAEAAQIMWEGKVGCILIMHGKRLLGVVTQTDLLDVFIAQIEARAPARYDHFLVPTNFSLASQHAIQTAQLLASRHHARLTLLHVIPRLTRILATDIDHASAESVTMLYDTCKADSWNRLMELVEACTCQTACQVVEGNTVDAIVRASIRLDVDLIIMGGHARSWRSYLKCSVSQRVMRRSRCPVLILSSGPEG